MRTVIALGCVAVLMIGIAVVGPRLAGGGPSAVAPDAPERTEVGSQAPTALGDVVLAGALRPFDACDPLLEHVKEHALEEVGPYGLGGAEYGFFTGASEMAMEEGASRAGGDAADAAIPAPAAGGGPGDPGVHFSTTNTVEEGVDEPDLAKTDGRILVTLVDGTMRVLDLTGEAPREVGSIAVEGDELLLTGDRVLVLGYGERGSRLGVGLPEDGLGLLPQIGQTTVLTQISLADPAQPEVLRRLELDGAYRTARVTDGVARVILAAQPVHLPFVAPQGGGLRAEDEATARNRAVIEASDESSWIPSYALSDGSGERLDTGLVLPCDQVRRPAEYAGLGMLTVLSVDLAGDLKPTGGATGVLTGGDQVYASPTTLYVATAPTSSAGGPMPLPRPPVGPASAAPTAPPTEVTSIHAFDVTDPVSVGYLGSGEIEGRLLDAYAMSERDGVLRVASTRTDAASDSLVTTLALEGGELAEQGRVDGLGPGEQIYAVRFLDDVGYVVTFRQTDPLYTIDLSDPAAPRVAGELKIPGFSSYLHVVGEDLLLGIGQDADPETGMTLGAQASLFDVSEPSAPTRTAQVDLGQGSSEVELDYRAFLWWAPEDLAVLPLQTYGPDSSASEAVALRVETRTALVDSGRVTHASDDPAIAQQWGGGAPILRALVVGDRLVTVSYSGVQVADLATFQPEAFVAASP